MKRASLVWLVLIQWVLAYEWLHSGWGKWAGSGFITNISKSLTTFSTNNPHAWYANFLTSTAIPNAELFGNLIRAGEIGVGIALALGGIILLQQKKLNQNLSLLLAIAFFAGALMNINFYFAAGWTSPSTWGVNVVMGLIHLILGIYYLTNRKELAS